MEKLPEFQLYGVGNPAINESIQPALGLRSWVDLTGSEKKVILQQLENTGWVKSTSAEVLSTIAFLNDEFLRLCPGKGLHAVRPRRNYQGEIENQSERQEAAYSDFGHILLNEKSEPLVLLMLSKFASCYIDGTDYRFAAAATDKEGREKWTRKAFARFDRIANCLNHIFEQFSINCLVTRSGIAPRQDEKITAGLYVPTLQVLSDPRWVGVNNDLSKMFQDYREQKYSESITKAHAAVHRFLQLLVGEEGKSGKGEVGKLFQEAKSAKLIPANKFSEHFINAVQSAIVTERATNSTAKPTLQEATSSDALLVMNLVIVFLQHCLTR